VLGPWIPTTTRSTTSEKAQKKPITLGASSTSSFVIWPTRACIRSSARRATPAAELLKALGIVPSAEGSKKDTRRVSDELAKLRAAFEAEQSR
jgi:hypothetical protein